MHACMHTRTHACMYAHIHTHTSTHAHTHAHAHTHTHNTHRLTNSLRIVAHVEIVMRFLSSNDINLME